MGFRNKAICQKRPAELHAEVNLLRAVHAKTSLADVRLLDRVFALGSVA